MNYASEKQIIWVQQQEWRIFLGGPGLYIVSFKIYSTYFPDLLVWWLEFNNMSPKWIQMMNSMVIYLIDIANMQLQGCPKEISEWLVSGHGI